MAKSKLGATCAAAVLSLTLASAQTTARQSPQGASARTNRGHPQTATISGCVVRDAINGGQATIASNGISYKLTGRRDTEFERYLGKRVEVTGTLDSSSTGARATSGKTSETGVQDATQPDTVPLATDKGTTADLTSVMQVKTIRMVAPSCL
jgi:hypothetical protein